MPQLDFFATKPDLELVFAFLYAETDLRIFESYSEFGTKLREFNSFDELARAYPVGVDVYGNGASLLLQMWSPSIMPKLEIERIDLDPKRCKGHTFRYRIKGYGLMQLYLGGIYKRLITHTHFGHFSERGAARWGDVSHVDWGALTRISGRFQRHVRGKLAVAKAPGRPVLADAFERFQEGYELRHAAQHPGIFTPTAIKPKLGKERGRS